MVNTMKNNLQNDTVRINQICYPHLSYVLLILSILLCLLTVSTSGNAHQHSVKTAKKTSVVTCEIADIRCAKTVTSAYAPNGDLWRLWVFNNTMWYQISDDHGARYTQPKAVPIAAENISARNENRPKIAFDNNRGVYLSWAMRREKKYTADIRFSYSEDYGKTFTDAITINNDNLLAGHSFNELHVTEQGDVSIVWLDGRLSHQLRKQGKKAKGSALYLGQANPREGIQDFTNVALANNTCVCCRIAIDENKQGKLAVFWRHIYGDNIREFALLTLNETQQSSNNLPVMQQISYDHWQIDGCPHQGGGISIDEQNQYHLVWFNQGTQGKGIFYAYSKDQGKSLSKPVAIGAQSIQAIHPNVVVSDNKVTLVWMAFNGETHELWMQQSQDGGKSFNEATILAEAEQGGDRPFLIKQGKLGKKHLVSWLRFNEDHWTQLL